jgi:hypothetical protein
MGVSVCVILIHEAGETYTTVRVVHGVHGNTTSLGPAVTLDSELVLGTRSLCSNY